MDYTQEVCKYKFSQGQIERMLAQLHGSRLSMLQSDALLPTNPLDLYVSSANVNAPCGASVNALVTVRNVGTIDVASYDVECALENSNSVSLNAGALSALEDASHTLEGLNGVRTSDISSATPAR